MINCAFISKNLYKQLFSYLVNLNSEFTLFALFQKRSQIVLITINKFDLENRSDFDFDRNKMKKLDFNSNKIKRLNLDLGRRRKEITFFVNELINKCKKINQTLIVCKIN